ncbi:MULTISPECIES: twin-arginine translocation signal domain-containing protein [Halomonas]|uniref:Twin-arginine translocation signal domain-containing protein n=1 Tax=Halomonas binhaiensis TaxID=2562282 RepID=A0A5C1NIZ7_9GAMM|nr:MULTISPECIES: twin-arginine translocation signal domain-containing protein [Halomonas]QEM81739.1 twin-arginine translocation signal domain-containing protein [Halomonas binhaiensis]
MKKTVQPTGSDPQRRRFLKVLGVGSVTAGVAAGITHVSLAQAEDEAEESRDQQAGGYRETQHIRDFYASLRD